MDASEVLQSVREFVEYLVVRRGASDRTTMAYAADVRSFAHFLISHAAQSTGDEPKAELPTLFLSWLRQRKNGPATIRRKLVTLSIYFRWRVELGSSPTSPFDGEKLVVRLPRRLPRALSRGDTRALLATTRRKGGISHDTNTNIALRLLLATGVRIGEMCAIDAADVATDGAAIRIKGKGDRERIVFVGNAALQKAISRIAGNSMAKFGPSGPLFVNCRRQRLTPQAFRLRLHQLAAVSGLPTRVTPHRLRHTAATLLIEEGVDIRFVQKLLGHASIATTEIYTKVADASLRAALVRADPLGRI